jgi:hypothetical protein
MEGGGMSERFEVISVDGRTGRPRRVLRQDVVTGEVWEEEWPEGYRPQGRVESVWNPLDALKESGE